MVIPNPDHVPYIGVTLSLPRELKSAPNVLFRRCRKLEIPSVGIKVGYIAKPHEKIRRVCDSFKNRRFEFVETVTGAECYCERSV